MTARLRSPGPSEPFVVRKTPADPPRWYHVYCTAVHPVRADTFNEGHGDTRFAPLRHDATSGVQTYYVASTPEAAYMESVLHDVALAPPGVFDVDSLRHYHLATVELAASLKYVSFHTPYLPALRLTRADLIDSLKDAYPQTRAWAQAAYEQRPSAQAIGYGSRRDDAARCLMLFGQRIPLPRFRVVDDESLAIGPRRAEVLELVRSLGVHEI
jgi:hypothetical protein